MTCTRLDRDTLVAFLLGLFTYALAAGGDFDRQSVAPHYVYLADALLHGSLHLFESPTGFDLIAVDGRHYVAGSPLPAILMIPFVALFGPGFSDVTFGVLIGALTIAAVQNTFRNRWLTLLFALGTPFLYLSVLGSVWFNAHVVAVLFGVLAVREAKTRRRWWLAGGWLALAGFSRPTLMFAVPYFVVTIAREVARERRFRSIAAFGAALAFGVAAHGAYNTARFGSPFDFGYGEVEGAPQLVEAHAHYGAFHPRFLGCNLFVSLLLPPLVDGYVPPVLYHACDHLLTGVDLADRSARIVPNPVGMSLLLATPACVLLAFAVRRQTDAAPLWCGVFGVMIPLWMYHNTGLVQFGFRYWMDAAPWWLALLALGVGTGATRRVSVFRALVLASVAINLWGLRWLQATYFR